MRWYPCLPDCFLDQPKTRVILLPRFRCSLAQFHFASGPLGKSCFLKFFGEIGLVDWQGGNGILQVLELYWLSTISTKTNNA